MVLKSFEAGRFEPFAFLSFQAAGGLFRDDLSADKLAMTLG